MPVVADRPTPVLFEHTLQFLLERLLLLRCSIQFRLQVVGERMVQRYMQVPLRSIEVVTCM